MRLLFCLLFVTYFVIIFFNCYIVYVKMPRSLSFSKKRKFLGNQHKKLSADNSEGPRPSPKSEDSSALPRPTPPSASMKNIGEVTENSEANSSVNNVIVSIDILQKLY